MNEPLTEVEIKPRVFYVWQCPACNGENFSTSRLDVVTCPTCLETFKAKEPR